MNRDSSLSSGAQRCLNRLRWYEKRYGSVHPTQSKLAMGLKISARTLRDHLSELRRMGLILVQQGGNGRAASYTIVAGLSAGLLPGCFLVRDSKDQTNEKLTKPNCRAEASQLCSILEYKNNPIPVVETTPGRTEPFAEEFRRSVSEIGRLQNLPVELVQKLCRRAERRGAEPSRAAFAFLEIYYRAHRQRVEGDGIGYLLVSFDNELAKTHPLPHDGLDPPGRKTVQRKPAENWKREIEEGVKQLAMVKAVGR